MVDYICLLPCILLSRITILRIHTQGYDIDGFLFSLLPSMFLLQHPPVILFFLSKNGAVSFVCPFRQCIAKELLLGLDREETWGRYGGFLSFFLGRFALNSHLRVPVSLGDIRHGS